MTVGVILNRRAGADGPSAAQLGSRLGDSVTVIETASTNEIPEALHTLRSLGVSALVPYGGDGTISRLLEAALPIWGGAIPPLLVLRAGTMNMLANALDRPREKPICSLERLLQLRASGTETAMASRAALICNKGAAGFTFGFGVPARFLEIYDGGGVTEAFRLMARAALSIPRRQGLASQLFEPLAIQWRADENAWQRTAIRLFLAMTIDELPLGFTVAPGAGRDNQAMQTLFGNPSPAFVLRNLQRLWAGRELRGHQIERGRARSLEFRFRQPTAWMMDGEIHPPSRELNLKLGPEIRFLCP